MRPLWSAGILAASPTPVSWYIKQLSRPSSVCGVAVGVAVGAAGFVGVVGAVGAAGADGVGDAGAGGGAWVPPPQETANKAKTAISAPATTYQACFFFTWFHLHLLIIANLT